MYLKGILKKYSKSIKSSLKSIKSIEPTSIGNLNFLDVTTLIPKHAMKLKPGVWRELSQQHLVQRQPPPRPPGEMKWKWSSSW